MTIIQYDDLNLGDAGDDEWLEEPIPTKQLTPSQSALALLLIDQIRKGSKRIVLKGSAGTGKTFMTDQLITILKRDSYKYGAVFVTAPTHKALSVLKGKITPREYIEFKTIHSALQLKRVIGPKGETTFAQGKINPKWPPFRGASLVLVDESSMLGTTELRYIEEYPDLQFIFIGDDKQLNPVGEEISPVFDQGWPTFELTEIVRQGVGNPIIDLSRNLKDIWLKQDNLTEIGGYVYDNNQQYIIEKLAEVNGTDDLKYLGWTNQVVDAMNIAVRQKIYGNPAKIELGETLVFNAPFSEFYTNQEYKVEELDVTERVFIVPNEETIYGYNSDRQVVIREVVKDGVTLSTFDTIILKVHLINGFVPVLHEDSHSIYQKAVISCRELCKKGLMDWVLYYWFMEQTADMTYNHAITVHKSQGSTYQKAIVNVRNINLNKNMAEKWRLFYTAITRAANMIIFYNT